MAQRIAELQRCIAQALPHCVGRRVAGVVEAPLWSIVLLLESPSSSEAPPSERCRLLLSANDDFSRLHLHTLPISPPKPPLPFGALVDKWCAGRILESIEQTPGDRIVTLRFHDGQSLTAELSGRRANLFLLDEQGVIRGMQRANRSQQRDLRVGGRWSPPAAAPPDLSAAATVSSCDDADGVPSPRDSATLERDFDLAERCFEYRRLRLALARRVNDDARKLDRAHAKAETDFNAAADNAAWRRSADLLASSFASLRPGMEQVVLPDFESGEPVTIPLNPALSPRMNLERAYKRAGKGDRGMEIAFTRMETLDAQRRVHQAMCEEMRALPAESGDLGALYEFCRRHHLDEVVWQTARRGERAAMAQKRRASEDRRALVRQFRSAAGDVIWVGRDARANHRLTFGLLKGHDMWLHASAHSGPHVGVPMPRDEDRQIHPETLRDAAALAAWYAGVAEGSDAEVLYCRRREVRSPGKRAPTGQVIVSRPKYLVVTVEGERLRRLKTTRDEKP